nr:hypothetical protein [Tanacetum cinerariifolium]
MNGRIGGGMVVVGAVEVSRITVIEDTTKEELITQKEEMELERTQSSITTKLPLLKHGDYEMWRLRIEKYFQIQDYALWDVIENGNSFKPVAIEEKAKKRMYKDANTLFAAIETRFVRNEATKKTQKTLLKQLYENFSATGTDTASPQVSTANLSDATVYAFLANQPNGSQLVHEDLEQIHEDDLEEIDLMWQLSLLSMRTKRFFQKTGKKITINGSDIAGYDKAKVECFNCHNMRHFTQECRVLRNQENKIRNQEITRWTVNTKDTSSKVMMAIDEAGFDWSYVADDKVPQTWPSWLFQTQSKKGLGYVSYNVVPPPYTGSAASPQVSTGNLSDATVYAFLANQPNGSQLVHEDLKQIHEDDLEKIDLKWQLALLNTSSKEMVEIDEAGFDWSYMANDETPTNMAFMALSDSEELDEEDEFESPPKKEKKTVEPSTDKIEDQRYFDSGCSWHMTRNISYLTDFKEFDVGYVAFGGGAKCGKITSKGTIKTDKLDFKDVYFVKELQFNLFSISQMCDKKNSVLFTNTDCFVLSHDFKLADESHVFFLATKDETSRILKICITEIENLVDKKVKIIRCDNRTEFKNRVMNEFCEEKGIKREYIVARTPQQNGVAKRRNKTLIEAARTMVLVVKPYFKTTYELFRGRTHALSFMRPFGCHVTILNTLDHLEKFDGKSDEGFFIGYSTNSKAFRVYNTRPRKVKENLHIKFLENKPLIAGQSSMETGPSQDYILMPLWNDNSLFNSSPNDSNGDNKNNDGPSTESEIDNQERPNTKNSTNDVNTVRPSINNASSNINPASLIVNTVRLSDDFFGADNDMRSLDGVEQDISNIPNTYPVPTTLNTRIKKDHSLDNVIGDIQSGVQTRRMTVTIDEQGFISAIYEEKTHMDVKSAFMYGRIKEEVYMCQPPGFEDPNFPDKVYKVEKSLYGLHQAPRAWYETLAKYLLDNGFRKGLQVKQKSDGMFISMDKYVDEIFRKF